MQDIRPNFVFFGGQPLAVPTLDELEAVDLLPSLIVCSPDRPSGRGQKLTPPPTKVWAQKRGIEVWQPEGYKGDYEEAARAKLAPQGVCRYDLFVVVAYNFILPKWLIELPKHQTLNVHPSLLPKLRGPSPIRTAIRDDQREDIGVSIMLLDEKMDHGPILDQIVMPIADENWPVPGPDLDLALARTGGALLAATIPEWLSGAIIPQEQDHAAATYTSRFAKADFKLELDPTNLPAGDEAWSALLKIHAFLGIGDAYFEYNDTRVKIKATQLIDDQLRLLRVTPAGKAEMDFDSFLQSLS